MPGAQPVATALAQARAAFKPATPESALPGLLTARAALFALPENPWKAEKLAAIEQAIVACAGLFAEVTSATPTEATFGEKVYKGRCIDGGTVTLKRGTSPDKLEFGWRGGGDIAAGELTRK